MVAECLDESVGTDALHYSGVLHQYAFPRLIEAWDEEFRGLHDSEIQAMTAESRYLSENRQLG